MGKQPVGPRLQMPQPVTWGVLRYRGQSAERQLSLSEKHSNKLSTPTMPCIVIHETMTSQHKAVSFKVKLNILAIIQNCKWR